MSETTEERETEYSKYLNMEYITQSDDAWTEGPLAGVKLALLVLSNPIHIITDVKSPTSITSSMIDAALELLSKYGNLEEMRRLGLREDYVKRLYMLAYGGTDIEDEDSEWFYVYTEDLQTSLDAEG